MSQIEYSTSFAFGMQTLICTFCIVLG